MSTPTSPTKPLSDRDVNTSLPSPTASKTTDSMEKDRPKSMEYHRQVLQNRLADDKYNLHYPYILKTRGMIKQVYISPSDAVLSPCTQKLSAYKGKRFLKAKPQTLFAKMDAVKKAEGAKSEEDRVGEERGS